MLYQCELKKDGIISERFFREGSSPEAIREDLESFQWPGAPKGAKWDIFLPKDKDETDL